MTTDEDDRDRILLDLVTRGDVHSLSLNHKYNNNNDPQILETFRDKNGSTLLHYAAGCGHLEMCRHLLNSTKSNALLHCRSKNNQRCPLHWAARNGHTNICKLFVLEYGVHVDIAAKGQVTPLQLSIWQCHVQTCKQLVAWGANPHFSNAWGCLMPHWLGKSPIFNADDANSIRKLESACHWLFVECGVKEYNAPNHHGQTPLCKAAFAGNMTVARYLVENLGVVDDIRDNQGNTAADCAERSKHHDMARWLRRYASAEVVKAMDVLGIRDKNMEKYRSSSAPPSMDEIRSAYLHLAKIHHPDKQSKSLIRKWNSIRDAYHLLQSWWNDDPDVYDCNIRILSRNANLLEYPRLCWYSSWHESQQSTLIGRGIHKRNNNHNDDLAEFESRLVRLLSSDSFSREGLSIAQLPKEYEKNFHCRVPKPRELGFRKLIILLQESCPRIHVEIREGKQALLRVVADRPR